MVQMHIIQIRPQPLSRDLFLVVLTRFQVLSAVRCVADVLSRWASGRCRGLQTKQLCRTYVPVLCRRL